jgi:putative ABC transport system ATP-binding protein
MVTHSPADAEYSHRTIHLFDGHVVTENFMASHVPGV